MEGLKAKYSNFKNAYTTLGKFINARKEIKNISIQSLDANDIYAALIAKHFELAFETGWKFAKTYLEEINDVHATSPKAVFRECYKLGLISEETATVDK